MTTNRKKKTPRQVALVITGFFLAYGAYAMWFAAEDHPVYAFSSWAMGLVWLALAWVAGNGESK